MGDSKAAIMQKIEQVPWKVGLKTKFNVGSVSSDGISKQEFGDGYNHTTILTINKIDAILSGDAAALSSGYLIYTFPAGEIVVNSSKMSMAITATAEQVADQADVGLGTTIGSGVNALLSAVDAAAENVITGTTAANANGTPTVLTVGTQLVIAAAGDHTLYFNIADTWADDTSGDLTVDIAGTVIVNWSFMG